MTDAPLGNPDPDQTNHQAAVDEIKSIVDTVLDLDRLLSAEVRRAEKAASIYLRTDLEAEIDELEGQLDAITDRNGRPIGDTDEAAVAERRIGETPESASTRATDLALRIRDLRQQYADSRRVVRMRQVPDEDWDAFEGKWRKALDAGAPYPTDFWDELITMSASVPTISSDQVKKLRKKLGRPQMTELGTTAWAVNVASGVSVPKSPLSSTVLRLNRHE